MQIIETDVVRAIRSFAVGSSGGSGGFRPHHLHAGHDFMQTRAKQAQACKTATCLRISDIFTYLFRYLLIHSITY